MMTRKGKLVAVCGLIANLATILYPPWSCSVGEFSRVPGFAYPCVLPRHWIEYAPLWSPPKNVHARVNKLLFISQLVIINLLMLRLLSGEYIFTWTLRRQSEPDDVSSLGDATAIRSGAFNQEHS